MINKEYFLVPDKCPSCNSPTSIAGEAYLVCTNTIKCPAQIVGRVKNWVAELNILELGDSVIEKLVSAGFVTTPADLYKLSVADIASLDRMGEKSAKNVYDSIWKNNPVTLDIFVGGLSLPMIGSSTIRLLMDAGYDTLDTLNLLTAEDIEPIKGIGPVRAESIVSGLKKYKPVTEALLANGVKIKDKVIGALTGKSFCFTGAMSTKRPVLEQMVAEAGGNIKSSVGKGLTYLVIADPDSTSSKAVAARKLGTVLITEDAFIKMAQ